MLEFLRSDESLYVYSNHQELQATANLYNINIHIFTYGGDSDRWTEIVPDAEMVAEVDARVGKLIPDMVLYHSQDTHYDLLVKEDSRLALLGLLAGAASINSQTEKTENEVKIDNVETNENNFCENFEWKIVTHKKKGMRIQPNQSEKLLEEGQDNTENQVTVEEDMDIMVAKQLCLNKTNPQDLLNVVTNKPTKMYECDRWDSKLESHGLLIAHLQEHKDLQKFPCLICDQSFESKSEVEKHVTEKHDTVNTDQWNCKNCPFQAYDALELMNHLKESGHQPSVQVEKKKVFLDYKQCYTCKSEFDGFHNLMNHRRDVHPSNKKCRNYPTSCTWGHSCWWKHQEPMDIDLVPDVRTWNFKCDLCDEKFIERNDFIMHKKKNHNNLIPPCEKFLKGECSRAEDRCWFNHGAKVDDVQIGSLNSPSNEQVFHKAPQNSIPPDQATTILQTMKTLCMKVEKMEKKFQELLE